MSNDQNDLKGTASNGTTDAIEKDKTLPRPHFVHGKH